MLDLFRRIFETDFIPYIYCLRTRPGSVWLRVLEDLATAASYYVILWLLFDIARKRLSIKFQRIAFLFVLFIAACGTTQLLALWVIWHPAYRLKDYVKVSTTLLSLGTAIMLLRLRPLLDRLPAPADLEAEHQLRREAENAAHFREERFRDFVENVEEYSIYMVDPQGLVLSWGLGAERMKGYSAEEIVGQSFERFYLPEDRAAGKPVQALRAAAETGRFEAEGWRLRKDGSRFLAKVVLHSIHDPQGVLCGFSKVTQNLTATRDMEAKYQALLEAAPDAIVIVDAAGNILYINAQAETLFGYSRAEVIGIPAVTLAPPAIRQQRVEYLEGLLEDGASSSGAKQPESVGLRKDGSSFPIEISVSPVETPEGPILLFAVRDLTGRQKREARFQALLESAPDAMVMVAQDGLIEMVNQQAEKMFGYARADMLGRPVEMLVPVSLHGAHAQHRSEFAGHPTRLAMGAELDLKAQRKDGTQFPVEISLSPIEGPDGISVTAAIRDVTERKLVMQQLATKADQLQQSNTALEQFAHFASHDLQEPLRMVASYTQLLSKRYKGRLDKDADEFIDYAVDGTRRMKRMIEDLLQYSRVGQQKAAAGEASTADALVEALCNLEDVIETSEAEITHDPLPTVTAVYSGLVAVLQNLVGNAIKYRGEQSPRIHISVDGASEEWRFSVADNGIGIDPAYRERVFQLFQRLHGKECEGTGIGLAICKRLVEQSGGKIWVEANAPHGSIFRFTLPKGEKNERILKN